MKTELRVQTTGFSLTELLVVMSISAILLASALPSFTEMVHGNSLSASINRIIGSIRLARSEAIKRQVDVSFDGEKVYLSDGGTLISEHKLKGNIKFLDVSDLSFSFNSQGFVSDDQVKLIHACPSDSVVTGKTIRVNRVGQILTTDFEATRDCT